MVLYLCVLIVFSLRRESLKLILATNPSQRWFCHKLSVLVMFDLLLYSLSVSDLVGEAGLRFYQDV
jgi:hypothetical protein